MRISIDQNKDSLMSKMPTTLASSNQANDIDSKFKTLDDAHFNTGNIQIKKLKVKKARRLEPLK